MAQAKRKPDKARIERCKQWIQTVGGQRIYGDMFESLRDGVMLCETVNKINPGTCKFGDFVACDLYYI